MYSGVSNSDLSKTVLVAFVLLLALCCSNLIYMFGFSLRSLFARRVKDGRPVEQRDPGWKLFGKVPPREGPIKDPKKIQKVQYRFFFLIKKSFCH